MLHKSGSLKISFCVDEQCRIDLELEHFGSVAAAGLAEPETAIQGFNRRKTPCPQLYLPWDPVKGAKQPLPSIHFPVDNNRRIAVFVTDGARIRLDLK